jgi:hypothetical protein
VPAIPSWLLEPLWEQFAADVSEWFPIPGYRNKRAERQGARRQITGTSGSYTKSQTQMYQARVVCVLITAGAGTVNQGVGYGLG